LVERKPMLNVLLFLVGLPFLETPTLQMCEPQFESQSIAESFNSTCQPDLQCENEID
jgi:hypothetical protein